MPDITNQAFIRPLRRPALFWDDIGGLLGLPYGLRERHLRYNKHLLDRYVPDAHGIQVLRDEHLDNAHDLSNWTITDLGHGRHLVEALDLAPWYANPLPDDDTVAQARHDFGAMILTEETISANPPPWKELGPSEN